MAPKPTADADADTNAFIAAVAELAAFAVNPVNAVGDPYYGSELRTQWRTRLDAFYRARSRLDQLGEMSLGSRPTPREEA